MRRTGFDPFSKISVKFSDAEGTSEGAVDEGGPCREMFRLSLNWLKDSGMFCGAHKKNLNLCGNALHKNMYFEAGRLIALSLIHGGPGLIFFSETLFSLLCDQIAVPTLDDIDRDVRETTMQFQNANELEELRTIIGNSDVFSLSGFPIIVQAEEQEKIVQGTLRFFAVDRIREPLRQLIAGLNTCGLYDKLVQYPSIFKDIFCSEITLSSKVIEELFLIVYTEPGTNTRSKENRVISYFRDYVLDLECDPTNIVTLPDLLVFATGSDCLPPLGFPLRPEIMFLHEKNSRFPIANTCSLQLKLPVVHTRTSKPIWILPWVMLKNSGSPNKYLFYFTLILLNLDNIIFVLLKFMYKEYSILLYSYR
uniref:HECT domain-containing protein n=1 Tax=Photinus pyralis TaxID=7054 RepID=A0A1Y1N4I9_PHOPY